MNQRVPCSAKAIVAIFAFSGLLSALSEPSVSLPPHKPPISPLSALCKPSFL